MSRVGRLIGKGHSEISSITQIAISCHFVEPSELLAPGNELDIGDTPLASEQKPSESDLDFGSRPELVQINFNIKLLSHHLLTIARNKRVILEPVLTVISDLIRPQELVSCLHINDQEIVMGHPWTADKVEWKEVGLVVVTSVELFWDAVDLAEQSHDADEFLGAGLIDIWAFRDLSLFPGWLLGLFDAGLALLGVFQPHVVRLTLNL